MAVALLQATGKHGNRVGSGGTSTDATKGFHGEKDDQDVQEARYTRGIPHVVPIRPRSHQGKYAHSDAAVGVCQPLNGVDYPEFING